MEELINEATVEGIMYRGLTPTEKNVYGNFLIESSANGIANSVVVTVRNSYIADKVKDFPKFAFIRVYGHLEYLLWKSDSQNAKGSLKFVADEVQLIQERTKGKY